MRPPRHPRQRQKRPNWARRAATVVTERAWDLATSARTVPRGEARRPTGLRPRTRPTAQIRPSPSPGTGGHDVGRTQATRCSPVRASGSRSPAAAFLVRASAESTGGAFSIVEEVDPLDTPPHVHAHEDELFQVLEGEHVFTVGGDELRVGPGGVVFAPRGVPHAQRRVVRAGRARRGALLARGVRGLLPRARRGRARRHHRARGLRPGLRALSASPGSDERCHGSACPGASLAPPMVGYAGPGVARLAPARRLAPWLSE